jgi:hypothetical protein
MVKAILGYNIMPGMSIAEYEKWLREIHVPDLSKIPGLKKIVFNTVKGMVLGDKTFFRIAELHYDNMESFAKAKKWRLENPISRERSYEGKTDFEFYVICETEEIELNNPI